MRVLAPQYRVDGRGVVTSPWDAMDSSPRVDLAQLACLFAGPALRAEFSPFSFWTGVEAIWEQPRPALDGVPLQEVFAAAIAELCADAGIVGVKLSGGLDSLAVLMHVAALRPARRVTAYSTDLIDDDGVSAVTIVRRLLCDLALDVDVHVVDPASCTAEPAWWPWGPRADALPAVNARVADLAADAGVDVLLSGDGADELLAVPRFATASLARAVGPRAACRYLADSRRSGPGVPGETLALVSSLMGPRRRARWYWATNWPQLCRPEASEVVCRPLRQEVLEWARLCIDTSVAEHATQRRTWADADRFDSFWPHSYIPPAGDVPEASPFLHEDVVAAALAGPVTARYDAALPTAYQRCKSAVVSLIPEHARTALPGRKQYFSCALAKAFEGPIAVPACAEAGLLDQDRLMVETDTSVRMMAAAVESWLASAVSAGAGVSSRIDLRAGPSAP